MNLAMLERHIVDDAFTYTRNDEFRYKHLGFTLTWKQYLQFLDQNLGLVLESRKGGLRSNE
jgi:hypothetical protein